MVYDITVNALTAFFILILLAPLIANLLIHLHHRHRRRPRVVWSRDGRIYLDGEDCTDMKIKSMEAHHAPRS